MSDRIAIFWPGDYRPKPNELALPNVEQATRPARSARSRSSAARRIAIDGFLTKPHEAIEKLGPIDDPLIGVCVHWFYGPHTTDGVVGKDNPLLLASNFSGTWPGLVGLLNTGACLESLNRPVLAHLDRRADDWTTDDAFMARLDEWCTTGAHRVRRGRGASPTPRRHRPRPRARQAGRGRDRSSAAPRR